MKFILIILSLFFSLISYSGEVVILDNNSNDSSEESHILGQIALELNELSSATKLIQRKIDSRNGKIIFESRFGFEELLNGVVLEQKMGRDIITMKAQNFSLEKGGELVVDFLSNGITGSRKKQLMFARPLNGSWGVYDEKGRVISSLKISTNKVALLGSIGIDQIQLLPKE